MGLSERLEDCNFNSESKSRYFWEFAFTIAKKNVNSQHIYNIVLK